jgi:hypothetical protein
MIFGVFKESMFSKNYQVDVDVVQLNNHTNFWRRGFIPEGYPIRSQVLKWYPPDSEEYYKIKGNKLYGPDDITYDLNRYGFRSLDFDPESKAKKIMFLGCSCAAGIGLPYEEVWTTVLTKMLSEHFGTHIEQHNYALPSFGSDTVAMNAHQILPIIKPHLLIVHYPDISRRDLFLDWGTRHPHIATFSPPEEDLGIIHQHLISLSYDANDFYLWCKNHLLVDYAAQRLGVPMLWSFTGAHNILHMKKSTLELHVNTNGYCEDARFDSFGDDTETLARDGMHPGRVPNQKLAQTWFKMITDREDLNVFV